MKLSTCSIAALVCVVAAGPLRREVSSSVSGKVCSGTHTIPSPEKTGRATGTFQDSSGGHNDSSLTQGGGPPPSNSISLDITRTRSACTGKKTAAVAADGTGTSHVPESTRTRSACSSKKTASIMAEGTGIPPPRSGTQTRSVCTKKTAPVAVEGTSLPSPKTDAVSVTASLVESIIYETKTYTILSCASTVTNCPARSASVVVSRIPVSTILVPVTAIAGETDSLPSPPAGSAPPSPSGPLGGTPATSLDAQARSSTIGANDGKGVANQPSATPLAPVTRNITSTVVQQSTFTTVSAGSTIYITSVISSYVTVCPVTATPVVQNVTSTSLETTVVTTSSAGRVVTITEVVGVPHTIYETVYVTASGTGTAAQIPVSVLFPSGTDNPLVEAPTPTPDLPRVSTTVQTTVSKGKTIHITKAITLTASAPPATLVPTERSLSTTIYKTLSEGKTIYVTQILTLTAPAPGGRSTSLLPADISAPVSRGSKSVPASKAAGDHTTREASPTHLPAGSVITSATAVWVTSVVYSTDLITVTQCASTVTDCPANAAKSTKVVTSVVVAYTTICPVTLTAGATVPTNVAAPPASTGVIDALADVTTLVISTKTVLPSIPTASPTSTPPAAPSTTGDNWWVAFRQWLVKIMAWLASEEAKQTGEGSGAGVNGTHGVDGINGTAPFNATGGFNFTKV